VGQNRNTQRRPVPQVDIEEQKLRRRILELARRHVRWGRRLVYRRLRLEGWSVNHKRVQRIWREEGQGSLEVKPNSVPGRYLASPAVPAVQGCHGPGRPGPP
jgi:transposase InsO family protein